MHIHAGVSQLLVGPNFSPYFYINFRDSIAQWEKNNLAIYHFAKAMASY